MVSGIDTALGEITLVLFTTLAPSGVVAFAIMGLFIVRGGLSDEAHRRIDLFLAIPLVVSMVGLVASATHLGNPANALFVFMGVERSPLSNEVFCAVVFLLLAGVYWLYSFAERPHRAVQRVWMALSIVAGIVFVTSVAFAYNAETIVSWYTVYVPLGLWLNALTGGPVLAMLGLRAAGCASAEGRCGRMLVLCSVASLAANMMVYAMQAFQLPYLENSFTTAAELVPCYGGMIAAFGVLGGAGIALVARTLRDGDPSASREDGDVRGFPDSRRDALRLTVRSAWASALVLAGIFVMRFAFYLMHMTVGLGI